MKYESLISSSYKVIFESRSDSKVKFTRSKIMILTGEAIHNVSLWDLMTYFRNASKISTLKSSIFFKYIFQICYGSYKSTCIHKKLLFFTTLTCKNVHHYMDSRHNKTSLWWEQSYGPGYPQSAHHVKMISWCMFGEFSTSRYSNLKLEM